MEGERQHGRCRELSLRGSFETSALIETSELGNRRRAASRVAATAAVAVLACFGGGTAVAQEDAPKSGCDAFTWDVSRELAVFDQAVKPLQAGRDAKSAPRADVDTHYVVALLPQRNVKFPAEPGKPTAADGVHAGLVVFRATKPGRYRVSASTSHWVDLVDGRNLVVSRDFQGQRGCEKVHKIVEFELSGNRDFVLQLSAGTEETVGLAITQVREPD
jgi:hypothetical protein